MSSLQNENSLLVETIDRLRSHIAELENDLSILQTSSNQSPSLSSNRSNSTSAPGGSIHEKTSSTSTSSYDMTQDKLHSFNEIISQLKHELLLKDELILKEKNKLERIQSEFLKEIESLKCEKNNLLSELKLRPERKEFNELRKQLKVIQNVLFHTEEEDEEDEDGEEGDQVGGIGDEGVDGRNENELKEVTSLFPQLQLTQSHSPHPSVKAHPSPSGLMKLESMLIKRLKTLEHELAENRVTLETLRHQEETAKKRVLELEHSLDDSQTLITQLEKDLESHVMTTSTTTLYQSTLYGARGGGGKLKKKDKESLLATSSDPSLVQLLTDSNDSYSEQKRAESPNAGASDGGQQQMISILQAQRDRYKERLENVSL